MTALAGLLRVDGHPVDPAHLAAMRARLAHRGRDASTWTDPRGSVALVVRATDPELGVLHGPADGSGPVVALAGTVAGSTAAGFEALTGDGPDAWAAPRGTYAGAVVDEARGIFLFRDHLGRAPLHWSFDGTTFAFATEIKALLAVVDPRPPLDDDALHEYVATQMVAAPRTLFRGIHELPPGHRLHVGRTGRVTTEAYWEVPRIAPTPMGAAEALDRTRAALDDALAASREPWAGSSAPIGVVLDGSVEQDLLAATLTARPDTTVHTFTPSVRSGPTTISTRSDGRRVDHAVTVDPSRFVADWAALVRRFDAPVPSPRDVVRFPLLRIAREHVALTVSGEGAAALFAGGPKYHWAAQWARNERLPGLRRVPAPRGRIHHWHDPFGRSERTQLLGPVAIPDPDELAARAAGDLVSRLRYVDLHARLSDYELESADHLAAAAQLPNRSVLADPRFVELAATLPTSVLVRRNQPQWILRELYRRTTGTRHRTANHLDPPIDAWLRGPLARWVKELLLARDSFVGSTFDRPTVARLLAGHRRGHHHGGHRIFTLAGLELWHRNYQR